jgi:hypothetical protein
MFTLILSRYIFVIVYIIFSMIRLQMSRPLLLNHCRLSWFRSKGLLLLGFIFAQGALKVPSILGKLVHKSSNSLFVFFQFSLQVLTVFSADLLLKLIDVFYVRQRSSQVLKVVAGHLRVLLQVNELSFCCLLAAKTLTRLNEPLTFLHIALFASHTIAV